MDKCKNGGKTGAAQNAFFLKVQLIDTRRKTNKNIYTFEVFSLTECSPDIGVCENADKILRAF